MRIVYILKFSCLNSYRKYLDFCILKIMVHKFINRYFHIRYAFFSFFSLAKFLLPWIQYVIDIFLVLVINQQSCIWGLNTEKTGTVTVATDKVKERNGREKKCQANLLVYFWLPRRQQQIESGDRKIGNNIRLLVYMYTNYKCNTLK